MFTLSAFADEIDPDPVTQLDVLQACGIRHVELRSILKTNVLDLTDLQVRELKTLMVQRGFRLSAIGSPIGKIKLDQPYAPHLKRFEHALELAKIFETPNVRIFSYYLPAGESWPQWREEILRRLRQQTALAEKAGLRLLHENEHAIYGDAPERVRDLFDHVNSPAFRAAYDPANFVFGGYDPWQGWQLTKEFTVHFHIKDWTHGETHGRVAGTGQGQVEAILRDAVARKYEGFATLEPHLLGGGPTGGVTGPELFPKAVAALRTILDRIGARHQ